MNKLIAVCGLDCATCPAYIAAATNDEALRERTAKEWSASFGFDCKPAMINCHGCLSTDGVQIAHCAECAIRLCAVGKNYPNCSDCLEFGCEKTVEFWKSCPEAKANLDALRI